MVAAAATAGDVLIKMLYRNILKQLPLSYWKAMPWLRNRMTTSEFIASKT